LGVVSLCRSRLSVPTELVLVTKERRDCGLTETATNVFSTTMQNSELNGRERIIVSVDPKLAIFSFI
jgi:hypothetical protein